MTPDELVDRLGLRPHPEGGSFVETWRGADGPDGRSVGTAIYFLLRRGERSRWHRVDSTEIWLYHAGDPLQLRIVDGDARSAPLLGPDVAGGEHPQVVIPPHAWQAAEPAGEWTLVSCIVSPGFEFAGFELAPPGWEPE